MATERHGICEANPYGFAIGDYVAAQGYDDQGWIDGRWELTEWTNGGFIGRHVDTGRTGVVMYVQCYMAAPTVSA